MEKYIHPFFHCLKTSENIPVRIKHLRVCPHFGVVLNSVNVQDHNSSLPELNAIQHTVLIAETSGPALQKIVQISSRVLNENQRHYFQTMHNSWLPCLQPCTMCCKT